MRFQTRALCSSGSTWPSCPMCSTQTLMEAVYCNTEEQTYAIYIYEQNVCIFIVVINGQHHKLTIFFSFSTSSSRLPCISCLSGKCWHLGSRGGTARSSECTRSRCSRNISRLYSESRTIEIDVHEKKTNKFGYAKQSWCLQILFLPYWETPTVYCCLRSWYICSHLYQSSLIVFVNHK